MSAPSIRCQVHERDGGLYLCLDGVLDQEAFRVLSQALLDHTIDRPVYIDLNQVAYADSSGIRALVLMQRQVRQAGVELVLLNPSEAIQRVFRTTGLARIFRIEAGAPGNPCADEPTSPPPGG